MIREPKIRGKDTPSGDKALWLHDAYTTDALVFYVKQHQEAQAALNNAAQTSLDPTIARLYERMAGVEEIIALLSYNEQNRDDDE